MVGKSGEDAMKECGDPLGSCEVSSRMQVRPAPHELEQVLACSGLPFRYWVRCGAVNATASQKAFVRDVDIRVVLLRRR